MKQAVTNNCVILIASIFASVFSLLNTATANTIVHKEKFPNYFNTAFATTLNTSFASESGSWDAWSNNSSATVVVVDYAQYSAPCAVKIVNYSTCGLTSGTAITRATSPVINLAPHHNAGTLFMDLYVFSYEAFNSAGNSIRIEFYNGASGNWVSQWNLTGTQFNSQVGLNAWKKLTLNIPAAYRRTDFRYRIVGTMNANVCGNQYIYFDDFAINSSISLLPADVEVTARAQGNTNLVQFTNFNEGGNRDYTIERSADGRSFSAIGNIDVQPGSGRKEYTFTDNNPLAAINYYRVVVNTQNGNRVYSAVKVVSRREKGGVMGLFPNPATNFINMTVPQAWQQTTLAVQVVAADGRVVLTDMRKQAAGTEWVNLNTLNGGAYRLVARNTATGEIQTISFIKQ